MQQECILVCSPSRLWEFSLRFRGGCFGIFSSSHFTVVLSLAGEIESQQLLPCLTYGGAQAQAKDMEPASIERLNEKQKQSKYLYF